jgi:FKBP-type peptidyl-prolyl cis-trans isomerase SlyD
MQIADKKVVSLTYELYIQAEPEDYEIVEVAGEDSPMVFLFGHSGLPGDFEKNLEGLKAADDFNFVLAPQDGFGEFSEEDIADFPIEMFKIEDGNLPQDLLEIGNFIPFTNDDGTQISGRVHEVLNDKVKIDFNHPLAGKTLKFDGKIISVRDATADELDHGHVHGEGGVVH